MTELDVMDVYIETLLKANTDLMKAVTGIYNTVPPNPDNCPYIIFNCQNPQDIIMGGGIRVGTKALYQIRVAGLNMSFLQLRSIATLLDTALNLQSGITGDEENPTGLVWEVCREKPISYTEKHSPTGTYFYRGGLYRIYAKTKET